MARQTWVQDPVTLKLIPKDEYQPRTQAGFFVMDDLKPYKSMITGEIIQGRAQHRAHLRQHGCIEVGNERLTPKKVSPISKESIKREIYQIANGKGW